MDFSTEYYTKRKRDMSSKLEALATKANKLKTSQENESKREQIMDTIRGRVVEMLNTCSSPNDPSTIDSNSKGRIIPSRSGGGKSTSTGTGWITSSEDLESSIPVELFEGEGKAVGDVGYVGAEDWKYYVETDRKRRRLEFVAIVFFVFMKENKENTITSN